MKIKITPELLNDLEHKARGTCGSRWVLVNGNELKPYHYRWTIAVFPDSNDAKFVAAANPAVVLALIEEIEQLRSIKNELVEELSCVLQHTDLSGWSLGEQIEKSATDLLRKISKTS